MDKPEDCLQQIETRLEELEISTIPDFSDYESLIKGRGLQKELTAWSKRLSKETQRFSKLKAELNYINELRHEMDSIQLEEYGEDLDFFRNQFQNYVSITRNIINTCKKLIESVRSLQTHRDIP